ncbi:MFS transporter [Halorubrum sp. ARQ200]|uniref:MFS transporter n=1 Tax=Halorubrum sp. ARQ200 TaxID=1855872 RepID=UPI0018EEACF3|nr:MFS transporter [Halorubrum sp. ARQ200]
MTRIGALGARLGVDSRASGAWALYDWANSAFATTVVAAVFPVYYESVIGAGLSGNLASVYFGYTTAVGLALVALASPVLGTLADRYRAKKRFLAGFVALGVVSTAGLFLAGEGAVLYASALFVLANMGFVGANVFYDSLLSHVASDADKLSTAGFAVGYLGGGILLVGNLAWILSPATFGFADADVATRAALLSVAVWWAVFSLPLFAYVDEPPADTTDGATAPESERSSPVVTAVRRLRTTAADMREYPDLLLFLGAFLLYADGIGTIIRMASIYGSEIGIGRTGIVGALVLVQFLGVPFAFLFGSLPGRRIGLAAGGIALTTKRAIYLGLAVYVGISVGGFFMTKTWHFWALAVAVATVQGGTQALSRSLYAVLSPPDKSAEFFSFFSISSKLAGVVGPALFAFVGQLTGSSRYSIVSLLVFFLGGAALLSRVDVDAGRRAVRDGPAPATADPDAGSRPAEGGS